MPIVKTKGAASSQGFGEFAQASTAANYIEDVFSTYLYTGTGTTNSIANNIDLAGKGGLVWIKNRTFTTNNFLADTARGIGGVGGSTYYVASNTTSAQSSDTNLMSVGATGFTLLPNATSSTNGSYDYASWTFRKQPKFFDVVTYTGTGAVQNIAHSLGSVPGCIIVKRTDSSSANWYVYHQSLGNATRIFLNLTDASSASTDWNSTTPTATQFTVSANNAVNGSGGTFVAYLFAHNAGGFGLTGTDNVISCGTFSTATSGKMSAAVNLGYEPQWLMVKNSGASENWVIYDNMRGMSNTGYAALNPNSSGAEYTGTSAIAPNATGFNTPNASGPFADFSNYIYIAIRRGPMKVPTDATKVYYGLTRTGTGANATISSVPFAPDVILSADRNSAPQKSAFYDKLRGAGTQGGGAALLTSSTTTEQNYTDALLSYTNTGINVGAEASTVTINYSGEPFINWFFQRAPSFFDEVCFSTDSSGLYSGNHNLGVTPELLIFKTRGSVANWQVVSTQLSGAQYFLRLNSTIAQYDNTNTNYTASSTAFTIPNSGFLATSASYVGYLFATCAGVSKVGSYTGTGATQTISCGFTGGARFVLIKRTDSTGSWFVWDTARGMVAGTDPRLPLNATTAESNANWVYTTTGGFQIVTTDATVNASGGTYIYLAIA